MGAFNSAGGGDALLDHLSDAQVTDTRVDGFLVDGFFDCDALALARKLIGCHLYLDGAGGVIVETEAYTADDPASHSFQGRTARNAVMFGAPGGAYVYRSYGLHWCLNIVAGDPGSAVLVRALEPQKGLAAMASRRGTDQRNLLCAGPGRLCQALGVTGAHNGLSLRSPPFEVHVSAVEPALVISPRIGISRAVDRMWRFGMADSPFLSRRFTANPAQKRPRAARTSGLL